jgi:hypothetical protein
MKRTHKLRAMRNVSATIAASPSVSAAAKALGVDRSTVTRWIATGKVSRPGGRQRAAQGASEPVALPVSADAWAADIRERYALTSTENTLVELGAAALTLALDPKQKPSDRAAASREFRSCVHHLNLEAEPNGEAETSADNVRAFPRPA